LEAIVKRVIRPEVEVCLLILFDAYETDTPQQVEISQVWARDRQAAALNWVGRRYAFDEFPLRSGVADLGRVEYRHWSAADVPSSLASRQMWEHLGAQGLLFLPLQVGARWIGVLGLGQRSAPDRPADDVLRSYQSAANQAATVIENHRLYESAQASLRELSALYRSFTGKAWGTLLQAQPEVGDYEYRRDLADTRPGAVWQVPLTVRGQNIGKVELESAGRQAWSEQERALVEAVTTQVGLALENARLFDQAQRLAGRERLINEITGRIRASVGVSAILQTAARELANAMNVPHTVARIQPKEEG
jgi:GAF domain-containing protein